MALLYFDNASNLQAGLMADNRIPGDYVKHRSITNYCYRYTSNCIWCFSLIGIILNIL